MASISFRPLILLVLVACNTHPKTNDTGNGGTSAIDSTISVPSGFEPTIVVPELAHNRHIAVNSNGDLYVKLEHLKDNKGIYVLRDSGGTYKVVNSFGNYEGTGILIKNGYLYASSNSAIYRYKLNAANEVADTANPEVLVKDLFLVDGFHSSKSIAVDDDSNIYVNIGAPSNICQTDDKFPDPCPLLEKSGGIWQFRADKANQSASDGVRFATGLRNVVGLDWNSSAHGLYAMQHGRDQLKEFKKLYDDTMSAELPAEEFFLIKKGGDYGWPYCYFDPAQHKKLLGPEYGGDGKKEERCAGKEQPIYGFPAHWAPNALLFYTGDLFPAKYKNGAFIAFHGSWNRAPLKQAGYCVVFLPFKDGKPSGDYEVFATGFKGNDDEAKFRPCGLAQGPNGELFVSESQIGRVWKIGYKAP